MIETFFTPYSDVFILIARAVAGIVFIYYGWPKVKDLQVNARDFVGMGFKPGWFWGTPIAFLEFFGGIGLVLGVFVPFFAVLFAAHMTVGTVWKITKAKKPFTDWSYDLALLGLMLLLLLTGAGAYALL